MSATRILGGVTATVLAVLLAIVRPSPLPALDRLAFDALASGDGDGVQSATSAVVAIDDGSLARLGQWPWPRDVVARLVDRLAELGATIVAFDVLFAETDRLAATGDQQLAAALRRVPSVIGHGFVFESTAVPAASTACVLRPVQLVERQRGDAPPRDGLFGAFGTVCSLPALAEAAGASGFINVTPDPDGLLRRVPLVLRQGRDVYASLALAAVHRAGGGGPVVLDAQSDGSLALTTGARTVAVDRQGQLLVRRSSTSHHLVLSAIDVLEGRIGAEQIRGRAIFIGATALGLRDVVSTPAERGLPGVMVHAAVANTLLGGPGFERPEVALFAEVAFAAFGALLVAVTGARLGLSMAVAVGLGTALLAGWAARAQLLALGQFMSPLWGWLAIALSLLVQGALTLWRERRRADREGRRRGDAQRLIIHALTTLTETRDLDTGRHARRTQELTRILATALSRTAAYRTSLRPDRIDLISTLAPLHDIGKVGVSDAVLRKPGTLTPDEHEEMRKHPGLGYDTLKRAEALAGVHDDEVLAVAKDIVYTHHERWDGSGYPRGLSGQAIPVSGRLVALVDAYDAMVERRAYHEAMPHEEAVAALVKGRGTHFDPDVVDAFLSVQEAFRETAQRTDTSRQTAGSHV